MSLPILQVPKYDLELLSTNKKVSYRPFLVKEQKILMQALQTGGRKDALKAIIDCAAACTFGEIDVTELPTFDLERLFLNIRAKSVGEEVPINVKCDGCGEYNPLDVKLIDGMQVTNTDNKFGKLELKPDYGLIFRFPNVLDMAEATQLKEDGDIDTVDFYYRLAKKCLKGVYQGEDFYSSTDSTEDEKDEVFEAFGALEFEKIQAHFDKLPQISYDLDFVCSKCKAENHLHVEGLDSFFG